MTSSTVTEPVNGALAGILVSSSTEHGLSTCSKKQIHDLKSIIDNCNYIAYNNIFTVPPKTQNKHYTLFLL